MARFIVLDEMQDKVLGTIDGVSRSGVYERLVEGRVPEFKNVTQNGFTIIEITPMNGEEALVCDKKGNVSRVSMAYVHWIARSIIPATPVKVEKNTVVVPPPVIETTIDTATQVTKTTVDVPVPMVNTPKRGRPVKNVKL